MSLYAADSIDDAFTATRELLTPVSLGRWAKLALVAFFAGGGTTVPTVSGDVSAPDIETSGGDFDIDTSVLPDDLMVLAAVAVAVGVLLVVLWSLVGSVMEFVLVESLRSREVTIRRYWGVRWRQGLRLFGFRLALGIPTLALFGGWLAVVLWPVVTDGGTPGWWLPTLLLGILLLFVVGLAVAVVYQFTTVFVVPIMITEKAGVLAAWRQFWPSLTAEWKQYLVYALINAALTGALGVGVALVLGFVSVAIFFLFGIILFIVFLAVGSGTVLLALFGVFVLLFVAVMAVVWAFVQVPVVTYLRYYALFVLGDIEPSFDLIPRQRADIRSEAQRR
jgi:MFS family permease